MTLTPDHCPGCARPYSDPAVTCTRQGPMMWVCNQAAQTERRSQVADWLIWLAMFIDEAQKADAKLRLELSKGAKAGENWAPEVPHEDDPTETLSAGKARFDPGQVTVRVVSQTAWLAWVQTNYPLRVVTQPASDGRRAASDAELDTLAEALAKVTAADYRGFDPYHLMAEALWQQLQGAGYQLGPLTRTEARSVVDRDWAEQLIKDVKANAKNEPPGDVAPVDGNGLPIDGIAVTVGPPKLVVTPSHDRYVTDTYSRRLLGVGLRELMPPDTPNPLDKTASDGRVEP